MARWTSQTHSVPGALIAPNAQLMVDLNLNLAASPLVGLVSVAYAVGIARPGFGFVADG